MKRLLTALVTSFAIMTAPVVAAEGYEFYNDTIGVWHVGGFTGSDTLDPGCYLETSWDDGSVFQLIKDLETGELYIWFQNNQWDISDVPGQYSMRMNLETPSHINGGNYNFQLINKNTIVINFLNVDDFIPSFMNGTRLHMIMPGTIPNAEVGLTNSSDGTAILADCIAKASQVKLNF